MSGRRGWPLALTVVGGVTAVVGLALVERDDQAGGPARERPVGAPDLYGLDPDTAGDKLELAGLQLRIGATVAGDDLDEGLIRSQSPPGGGGVVVVEVSGGGPVISAADLPPEALALIVDDPQFDPAEPVRVFPTAAGIAYKVDHVLFGPCDAVDLAYRQFLDPRYDNACH